MYIVIHPLLPLNMNELTALVDSGTRGGHGSTRGGRRGGRGRGDLGGFGDLGEGCSVVYCFYCKEHGHIKKFCPKLIGKNTQSQSSRFAKVLMNNQA